MYSTLRKVLKIRGVKALLEIGLILLLFILLKTWLQRNMVSGPAPTIQARLLDGRDIDSVSLRGKPLLIHFWASWCNICRLEQASIESISHDHAVITIAMNSGNAAEVRQYMAQHHLAFPVVNDPDGTLARRYGVRAVPASFIVNPAGEIVFRERGYTTGWGLRLRLWWAAD